MKAPPFAYRRPDTLAQALSLLEEYGDEAQVLAGGQSLMAMLNMRISSPAALIDINRIVQLRGIEELGSVVRVGALTRYVELQESAVVQRFIPLLALAVSHIAHVAIRNRGTIGGSLVLSDPSAEMPACCVAAGAKMVLASQEGTRVLAAEDFATGLYETARRPNEILLEIHFPKADDKRTTFIKEFSLRRGDFAIVGLAGSVCIQGSILVDPQLVFFGCEDRPVVATRTAAAIDGRRWDEETARAAAAILDEELDPMESAQASAAYRRTLARVLMTRVLHAATIKSQVEE
jgi:carbon-monoxide dehydrogenase medium subunit